MREGLSAECDRLRGYADFAPLGHSVRVISEDEKARSHGRSNIGTARKRISVPITTTPWGTTIPKLDDVPRPRRNSRQPAAYNEPEGIHMDDGDFRTLHSSRDQAQARSVLLMPHTKRSSKTKSTSWSSARPRRKRRHLGVPVLGAEPEDCQRGESKYRSQRCGRARPVRDKLLHGHAMGRKSSGGPRAATRVTT